MAEIDLADAEDAGEGSTDRLALDRGADLPDSCVRRLECRRRGVVGRLRDQGFPEERLRARELEPSQLPLRFGRGELRPLLLRVQADEHVALIHRLAGSEADLLDQARHIGGDSDTLHRGHTADGVQVRVPLVRFGDDRGHRLLEGV